MSNTAAASCNDEFFCIVVIRCCLGLHRPQKNFCRRSQLGNDGRYNNSCIVQLSDGVIGVIWMFGGLCVQMGSRNTSHSSGRSSTRRLCWMESQNDLGTVW